MSSENLEYALKYIDSGFHVFPLHTPVNGICDCHKDCSSPGKHPRTINGLNGATNSRDQVEQWWIMWPHANIGIATGAKSGFIVLDIDEGHGGRESIKKLVEQHGLFPERIYQRTGGGGWHILFSHPGIRIGNIQGSDKLGKGIDVRGDGGYIVAAPSLHVSGQRYSWGTSFDTLPDAPKWLIEVLRKPEPSHQYSSIADIPSGQRNNTLTSIAGSMRRRGLSEGAIAAALRVENLGRCVPPLDDVDVDRIARSIARYSPEAPIQASDPQYGEGIYSVNDLSDAVDELYEQGLTAGASTGWRNLDKLYTVKRGQWSIVSGIPSHGKALALNTPIPTPSGWTTMGEIRVGDTVFDEDGFPCKVVGATEIMYDRECFELEFSDGTKVICDAEHQWLTRSDKARISERNAKAKSRHVPRPLKPKGKDQTHLRTYPSAVTTREIANTLHSKSDGRNNHSVSVAGAIETPYAELPIDPYVLGAWLGDGTSSAGAITIAEPELRDLLLASGRQLTKWKSAYSYNVIDLKSQLRLLGVLGNKHIPSIYLRASRLQRLALLQGLMDTDGSVTPYGRCEFTNMNRQLAKQVYELIASLGWIPKVISGRATLYGKDCGEKLRVTFTPDASVFRLTRKGARINTSPSPRLKRRSIVGCRKVTSVPVKCIQVDSASHLYLCTEAFIPTHNSTWLDALLVNLAMQHGWKFCICSPENQPIQRHIASLMSQWAGEPFSSGMINRMSPKVKDEAKAWVQEHFVFVLPLLQDFSVEGVLDLVSEVKARRPVDGVIIDPWNELEHKRPSNMNETEYVSQSLSFLRKYARAQDIHLWLVVHPTKLYRDKTTQQYPVPTLYDTHGSAHFRNKADMGVIVWRDLEDDTQPTEIHVQKVRFRECGQVGMAELYYDKITGRFSEEIRVHRPEKWVGAKYE